MSAPKLKRLPPKIRRFSVRSRLAAPGMYQSVLRRLGERPPEKGITATRKDASRALDEMTAFAERSASLTGENYFVEIRSTTGKGEQCSVQVDKWGYWFPWRCSRSRS